MRSIFQQKVEKYSRMKASRRLRVHPSDGGVRTGGLLVVFVVAGTLLHFEIESSKTRPVDTGEDVNGHRHHEHNVIIYYVRISVAPRKTEKQQITRVGERGKTNERH